MYTQCQPSAAYYGLHLAHQCSPAIHTVWPDSAMKAFEHVVMQPSLSQMASLTPGAGGANLLHELIGFLRRSLTQHAAIREALYQVSMPSPQPVTTLTPVTQADVCSLSSSVSSVLGYPPS